jgi:hypothetical protein
MVIAANSAEGTDAIEPSPSSTNLHASPSTNFGPVQPFGVRNTIGGDSTHSSGQIRRARAARLRLARVKRTKRRNARTDHYGI